MLLEAKQRFFLACSSSIWYLFVNAFLLQNPIGEHRIVPAMKTAGDVFVWQMFASVIIPGFVINRITWAAGHLSKAKVPGIAGKWLPTCIGLAAIPLIIRPIDTAVDHAMDRTYRKYIHGN